MKVLFLFFVFLTFSLTLPVSAQEDAEAVLAEQAPVQDLSDQTMEERLALARKMHEIWPVRTKVENAIDAVAENVPMAERAKFKATMRHAMEFEALEDASVTAMAEIFTIAELKAMIDFYGSKEGRSIGYKTGDYEKMLQPLMVKMMDKALLDARLGASTSQ